MRFPAAVMAVALLATGVGAPAAAAPVGSMTPRGECTDRWHVVAVERHSDTSPTFTEQPADPDLAPVERYFTRTERVALSKRCAGEFRMRVTNTRWTRAEAPAPPPIETDSDQTRPGCPQQKWRTVVHRARQVDESPGFVPADQAAHGDAGAYFARGQWVTARKLCGDYRFVIHERGWRHLDVA